MMNKCIVHIGDGDWGLGIGDWGLGIGPTPQSPIPNKRKTLLLTNMNYPFIHHE